MFGSRSATSEKIKHTKTRSNDRQAYTHEHTPTTQTLATPHETHTSHTSYDFGADRHIHINKHTPSRQTQARHTTQRHTHTHAHHTQQDKEGKSTGTVSSACFCMHSYSSFGIRVVLADFSQARHFELSGWGFGSDVRIQICFTKYLQV